MKPTDNITNNPTAPFSAIIGYSQSKPWFFKFISLLRYLETNKESASLDNFKNHVISLRGELSDAEEKSSSGPLRIGKLYRRLFPTFGTVEPSRRASLLFSSKEFRLMIPEDNKVNPLFLDRNFVRNWVLPSIFHDYPDIENIASVPEVKSWAVEVLAGTITKDEYQDLKNRIDGLTPELIVSRVGLKSLLRRNFSGSPVE